MSTTEDEKLVERVGHAIIHADRFYASQARAAIAAMREAGWEPREATSYYAPILADREQTIRALRTERDREKARADRLSRLYTAADEGFVREQARANQLEQTIQERNNTIACQDRRYGDLERELREQRDRAQAAEHSLMVTRDAVIAAEKAADRLQSALDAERERAERAEAQSYQESLKFAEARNDVRRLERELRELREQRATHKFDSVTYKAMYDSGQLDRLQDRVAALEQASQERCQDINEHELRLTKLEQPQPPSAPAQPNPDAASRDAAVLMNALAEHDIHWPDSRMCQDMLDNAAFIARLAGLHVYDTQDALVDAAIEEGWDKGYSRGKDEARAGLHVWSGDVEGLKSEIRSMKIAYPYNLSLDKILRKYGLIQAPAGDAGEGE